MLDQHMQMYVAKASQLPVRGCIASLHEVKQPHIRYFVSAASSAGSVSTFLTETSMLLIAVACIANSTDHSATVSGFSVSCLELFPDVICLASSLSCPSSPRPQPLAPLQCWEPMSCRWSECMGAGIWAGCRWGCHGLCASASAQLPPSPCPRSFPYR